MATIHELALQFGGQIDGNLTSAMRSVEEGLRQLDERVDNLNDNSPNVDAISEQFLRLNRAAIETEQGLNRTNNALSYVRGYRAQKEAVDGCAQSLAAARTRLDQLRASEGATAAQIRAAERDVRSAETAFNRQNATLQRLEQRLRDAGVNMDDLASEEERLAREADEAADEIRRLNEEMQRTARQKAAVSDVKNAFNDLKQSIANAAKQYAIMAGAITGAGAALYKITSDTAAYGDVSMKTARKLRMDVEAFQELQYAAGLSGIKDFSALMTKMNASLAKAAGGSGEAAKELAALGLNAKQFAQMKPEAAILVLADELNKIKDPAQRARAEIALFGKSGAEVASFFAAGSEGIKDMMKTARDSGIVMNEAAAVSAEAFDDARDNMAAALTGLKMMIGTELLPVFTEVFDEIAAFFRDNKDLVREFAKELADGVREFIPSLKEIALSAKDFVKTAATWGKTITGMFGGLKNLAKILALLPLASVAVSAVMFGKSLYSLVKAFGGVKAALSSLGSILTAHPIIMIGAAVAGAAVLIYKNWDSISAFFKDVWGRISTGAETLGAWLSEMWSGLKDYIVEKWNSAAEMVCAVWDYISSGAAAVWEAIKSGASVIADVISAPFIAGWELLAPALDQIAEGAAQTWAAIKAGVSVIAEIISAPFKAGWAIIENVWRAFHGEFDGIGEFLSACFNNVFEIITGPFTRAFDWVSDKWQGLKSMLGMGAEINAEVRTGENGGGVRHFARGGIITKPVWSLAGEDGKEAIVPLEPRHAARGLSVLGDAARALGADVVPRGEAAIRKPVADFKVPEFELPKIDLPKFAAPKIELPEFNAPQAPSLDLDALRFGAPERNAARPALAPVAAEVRAPEAPAPAPAQKPAPVTAQFTMPAITINMGGAEPETNIREAIIETMREVGARLIPEWAAQIERCSYAAV